MNRSLLRAGTLASLILLAGAAPAHAAWPGHNGRIAFDSDRDGGDYDVWTMNKKGGDLVNLTANSPGFDGLSSWSADGRKLVFISDRATPGGQTDVFTMDADGGHVRQLTHNPFDDEFAGWSPGGQSVVIGRDLNPVVGEFDEDLFVLDVRTGRETSLTHSPGRNEYEPVWSPDGQQIAYASDAGTGDLPEIYVLTLRTGAIHQLTHNTADDEFPDWSPDGKRFVFNSDRAGNGFNIWTMRADGSDQRRLTTTPDAFPVWSPNGRKIIFASKRTGDRQIFTMRADGSHQKQLTAIPGTSNDVPDWQPR